MIAAFVRRHRVEHESLDAPPRARLDVDHRPPVHRIGVGELRQDHVREDVGGELRDERAEHRAVVLRERADRAEHLTHQIGRRRRFDLDLVGRQFETASRPAGADALTLDPLLLGALLALLALLRRALLLPSPRLHLLRRAELLKRGDELRLVLCDFVSLAARFQRVQQRRSKLLGHGRGGGALGVPRVPRHVRRREFQQRRQREIGVYGQLAHHRRGGADHDQRHRPRLRGARLRFEALEQDAHEVVRLGGEGVERDGGVAVAHDPRAPLAAVEEHDGELEEFDSLHPHPVVDAIGEHQPPDVVLQRLSGGPHVGDFLGHPGTLALRRRLDERLAEHRAGGFRGLFHHRGGGILEQRPERRDAPREVLRIPRRDLFAQAHQRLAHGHRRIHLELQQGLEELAEQRRVLADHELGELLQVSGLRGRIGGQLRAVEQLHSLVPGPRALAARLAAAGRGAGA